MSDLQELEDYGKVMVACDYCKVESEIQDGFWSAHCQNHNCYGPSLLFRPLNSGYRYIQFVCQSVVKYTYVPSNDTTFQCKNCDREYTITNMVVQICNNQLIYRADMVTPIEEDLDDVKQELTEAENELEELRKRVQEFNEKMEENMRERIKFAEEQCKTKDEAMGRLQQKIEYSEIRTSLKSNNSVIPDKWSPEKRVKELTKQLAELTETNRKNEGIYVSTIYSKDTEIEALREKLKLAENGRKEKDIELNRVVQELENIKIEKIDDELKIIILENTLGKFMTKNDQEAMSNKNVLKSKNAANEDEPGIKRRRTKRK